MQSADASIPACASICGSHAWLDAYLVLRPPRNIASRTTFLARISHPFTTSVARRMGSNLAVLLLNKLLLTFWSFRQPVLLTFLHMATATVFTWGLWSAKALTIQRIQSTPQLLKLMSMSLVFALAILSANVSLKFLAVSMNQAIGAATPVFAAFFAFICQGACPTPNLS